MIQRRTVGIVGAGNVGVAAAYALFNQQLASEIILVDRDEERAEGEAMDLMHGQLLVGNVSVHSGSYEDLADAQVVIVTAGVGQASPDESRLALLERNAEVFNSIVSALDRHVPEAILVIATNPVDVLTYAAQEMTHRPADHVIGTGTLLDTARFRALLGQHYEVDPRSVHAYILGEHGDSEVPIWSQAAIGGCSIQDGMPLGKSFDAEDMQDLFEQARDAAYEIIRRKGHTNTAIGVVIARIVRVILGDERSVLPVSVRPEGAYGIRDVCLSIPCVLGLNGVAERITPELSVDEEEALRQSASRLQTEVEQLPVVQ